MYTFIKFELYLGYILKAKKISEKFTKMEIEVVFPMLSFEKFNSLH